MTTADRETVDWIRLNLETVHEWAKDDFFDFYMKDVPILLGIITRLDTVQPKETP